MRGANLIWNVGPSPRTHVQAPSLGYSSKALCGWDLRKGAVPTIDSDYGEPECPKCRYLLNRLSDADLKEAGVEYKEGIYTVGDTS